MIIYKYSRFLKDDHADFFGVSIYVQLLAYIYTMTRVDTGSKFVHALELLFVKQILSFVLS